MKKLIALFALMFTIGNIFGVITINPATIDTAYCQHTYSFKCTATGGTAPYQYTISVGSLPTGCFLNKTTGAISSTNVNYTAATSVAFTVRATDATGATGTRAYTMYIVNYPATYSYIWPKFKNMPNSYPTNADAYDGWRLFATGNPTDIYWGIGGNTITAAKKLGSLDAFDVNLVTNNVTRATIYGNGNGVNIATSLYVAGNKLLYLPGGASGNTSLGAGAGNSQSAASGNTNIGALSLTANTNGDFNTAVGYNAMKLSTTAASTSAFGYDALKNNTTGNNNCANGFEALTTNTTGNGNTANGYRALKANTTGSHNTAVGTGALASNTTADELVGVGYNALNANTTGVYNVATGNYALAGNTTGTGNTAVGEQALRANVTSTDNTAVGSRALIGSTGVSNTAVGTLSLSANVGGGNNAALGYRAGAANTSGANNTYIGYNAGATQPSTGSGNTVIGAGISPGADVSDHVYLGSAAQIRLQFDNTGALRLNGPAVTAKVAEPSTHVVTINIGGTTYYLLATNVAP